MCWHSCDSLLKLFCRFLITGKWIVKFDHFQTVPVVSVRSCCGNVAIASTTSQTSLNSAELTLYPEQINLDPALLDIRQAARTRTRVAAMCGSLVLYVAGAGEDTDGTA